VILPHLQPLAQTAIERALNSLPEGLMIALLAWASLFVLPKQNSRTRFAVWFVALLAVVGSPLAGGFLHSSVATAAVRSAIAPINLPAHWAAFFFITWLLVACAMTARLIVGLVRLRQLRQSCVEINVDDLDPSLRSLIAELNAAHSFHSRPVSLSVSSQIRVPAAIGLWNPTIALPLWALRDLSPSDLGIVLRHEFAHLRHWDDWTNLIQKLLRILFFFHPAVWWIENRLSLEREMACDDVVIAQTANPTGYASCLVSLLERSLAGRGWTMAQAIVHRAREASTRIAQILDNNRPVATRISKPALGLVGAFTILCLVMLPNTPQVISFEQPDSANDLYAATPIQPSLVHRTSIETSALPAAAIPATFKTASHNGKATILRTSNLSRSSTYNSTYHASARNTVYTSQTNEGFSASYRVSAEQVSSQAEPVSMTQLFFATRRSPAQGTYLAEEFSVAQGLPLPEEASLGTAQRFEIAQSLDMPQALGTEQSFGVAQRFSTAIDAASWFAAFAAEGNTGGADSYDAMANTAHPSIVLVQATEFVQPDGSPAMVWHVQVWHVTAIKPMLKVKQPAPVAHTT